MKTIKYILARIIAVVILFFLANELYKVTFYKNDISKHGHIIENLWMVPDDADGIYFGESSNFHITDKDTIKHRISHILNDITPNYNIATVDHSGLHAGTYLTLLKNLPKSSEVKFIIVTMNYRSFSANWRYSNFENYLSKTSRMIEPGFPILNRFMLTLKQYDYQPESERNQQIQDAWRNEKFDAPGIRYDNVKQWDSAMAWGEWVKENPNLGTAEQRSLACHYIKNFAFEIDTLNNERIKDFDKICKWAEQRDISVFFNLLDENMTEANKLVGDPLMHLFEKNRQLLLERYTRKGAIIIDNFHTIPDEYYVDRHWPTEHYSYEGKEKIAEKIKEVLSSQ